MNSPADQAGMVSSALVSLFRSAHYGSLFTLLFRCAPCRDLVTRTRSGGLLCSPSLGPVLMLLFVSCKLTIRQTFGLIDAPDVLMIIDYRQRINCFICCVYEVFETLLPESRKRRTPGGVFISHSMLNAVSLSL
jgi:hypothetical protein